MVKKLIKVIISLSLFIVFLVVCFALFAVFSIAGWLHTYKTFTQKELVAVVELEGMQIDEQGYEYTTIKYKPVKDQSALTSIFSSREGDGDQYEETKEYKIYGDQVELGGDFIKFSNALNLFGIKNIYKVSRLEGDFSNPDKAANVEKGKRTVYAINGGTDDYWKFLQENTEDMDFIVDSVYGSYSSKFIRGEKTTYGLYVTEDGFILDDIDKKKD
ncbi:MAG: hypothetical protein US52_C0004G0002 [candidate division WS6 bacterium GW2011_GWA2_37_6]|uniref:Uncharacterized protein n=1 Tax=candidate division WS6 bacterium GW2011_GWA2_37_6 TaxID=1619087 RepID=A0A0G0K6I1_9BACT|nr:MAG: hypothetical protein US52_C0004G0002 [candidate division WS6 bacterium GW2011_GWA2_37_6]